MSDRGGDQGNNHDNQTAILVGVAVILALLGAGLFLTKKLKETSDIQDCVMSGRTNCAPIPMH